MMHDSSWFKRRWSCVIVLLTLGARSDAFLNSPHKIVAKRRSSEQDEFDDFDFESAYRERVAQVQKKPQAEEEDDLMKTAILGATGVGGGVVTLIAALSALSLGIFLLGTNSPLKAKTIEASPEVSCVFSSNCD